MKGFSGFQRIPMGFLATTKTQTMNSKDNLLKLEVKPLNSIDECVKSGLLHKGTYIFDKDAHLEKAEQTKTIYFVPGGGSGSLVLKHLSSLGLKPCIQAPNYLLGVVKLVSEGQVPQLKESALISLTDEQVMDGTMYVDHEAGVACIHIAKYAGPGWFTSFVGNWFFLAEEV